MYKSWMFKQRSFRLQDKQKADGDLGGAGGSGSGDGSGEGGDEGGDGSADGEGDDAGDAGDKGKAKPTDAEAKLLKEVMDKKTALRNTQAELNDVKTKLAAFDGLDAAELKTLVSERKVLETRKLEEKGEWERLKAQMADENRKAVDEVTLQLTSSKERETKLSKQVAELTVGGAFTSSAYIKEELTLPANKARALYGSHFEFSEAGTVVAYDKPAGSAERTIMVNSQGEPLVFEAALKKLVEADPDHEQITKSKVKPGSGSKTNDKGAPPAKQFDVPRGIDAISAALKAAKTAAQ